MLPVGPILMLCVAVLAAFGCLDGLLARLPLTPPVAAVLSLIMLATCAVDVSLLPGLWANLGGVILPLLLAAFLLTDGGAGRALAGTAVVAAGLLAMSRLFPPDLPTELNLFGLDAQYLYALVAGLLAYGATRQPRSAFAAGIIGVAAAGLAEYLVALPPDGLPETVTRLGGGGRNATAFVAGALAVFLAHWMHPVAVASRPSSLHVNRP